MKKSKGKVPSLPLQGPSALDGAESDALHQLHRFESTGLIGLKTAAVAAMTTAGQPLAGLFRPNRTLISDHLRKNLRGSTHVSASRAREIADGLDISIYQLMSELIPVARIHAVASISNYRVGVVGRGTSGDLYLGFNVEFPDVPLTATVHAEQAVVVNAMAHREKGLEAIASSFAPSGHSRQFLYELPDGGDLKVLVAGRSMRLRNLLPSNFGPKDLGIEGTLMSSSQHSLAPVKPTSDSLVLKALEAANRSYAPYTHCPSGIALQVGDAVITGSYCENAAFNPSLSPLQAALVNLTARGKQYGQISRAVLVERQRPASGGQVMQSGATRLLLEAVAPEVKLEVCYARVH